MKEEKLTHHPVRSEITYPISGRVEKTKTTLHKMSTDMHNNHHNCLKGRFAVEERRRQVALLLAQAKTELQIASLLNVDQGTISRDIKALRELSRQFVFDLAKSDLAFYYRQCIDGIECVLKRSYLS